MSENAVEYEDKQIKATSGKIPCQLANNIFRITRSLDIYTNGLNKYTYSQSCSITIAYCMFLLFLGHHQGDNRYKKWIKHLYTG